MLTIQLSCTSLLIQSPITRYQINKLETELGFNLFERSGTGLSLTIPDSNSRVQAVIDGQGLGLWDDLVAPEISAGQLIKLSNVALDDSGYTLCYHRLHKMQQQMRLLNG